MLGSLGTVPATVPTARKQEKEMIKNHQQHATDIYREELAQEKQWNRALLHTLTHVCTHTSHSHTHTHGGPVDGNERFLVAMILFFYV